MDKSHHSDLLRLNRLRKVLLAILLVSFVALLCSTSTLVLSVMERMGAVYAGSQFLRLGQDSINLVKPDFGNRTEPLDSQLKDFAISVDSWARECYYYTLAIPALFGVQFCLWLKTAPILANLGYEHISVFLKWGRQNIRRIGILLATAQLSGAFFFLANANAYRQQALSAFLSLFFVPTQGGVAGTRVWMELTWQKFLLSMQGGTSMLMLMLVSILVVIVNEIARRFQQKGLVRDGVSLMMIQLLAISIAGTAMTLRLLLY